MPEMRVQRGHGAREVAGGDGLAHVGREGRRDVRREKREEGLPCSASKACRAAQGARGMGQGTCGVGQGTV